MHACVWKRINAHSVYGIMYNGKVGLQISLSRGGNVVVFDVGKDDYTPYHFARSRWEEGQDNSYIDHLRTFAKHLREKTGFVMPGTALCSRTRIRCRCVHMWRLCTKNQADTHRCTCLQFLFLFLCMTICVVSHVQHQARRWMPHLNTEGPSRFSILAWKVSTSSVKSSTSAKTASGGKCSSCGTARTANLCLGCTPLSMPRAIVDAKTHQCAAWSACISIFVRAAACTWCVRCPASD